MQKNSDEPIDALLLIDMPAPRGPGYGEILVRVLVTPIHHHDLFITRVGENMTDPISNNEALPRGSEAMGIIESLGPYVPTLPGLRIGARVAIFPALGAWREKIIVHFTSVVVIPDSIPDHVASLMLVNAITALMIVREVKANLKICDQENPVVVQTAVGSAVAQLVTLLAILHSIQLVNIVRGEGSAAEQRKLFPSVPVVSTEDADWQQETLEQCHGHPICIAIDCVGGALTGDLVNLLSDAGTVVVYGGFDEVPITVTALQITSRELTLRGVSINRWHTNRSIEGRNRDIKTALVIATKHPELFKVAAEYPLEQLAHALEHAERPQKDGSVLLRISNA
jgi:NADPH:quinone reductase-like Zn-dependent oxidoreductase